MSKTEHLFTPARLDRLCADLTDFAQELESRGLRTEADSAMILAAYAAETRAESAAQVNPADPSRSRADSM